MAVGEGRGYGLGSLGGNRVRVADNLAESRMTLVWIARGPETCSRSTLPSIGQHPHPTLPNDWWGQHGYAELAQLGRRNAAAPCRKTGGSNLEYPKPSASVMITVVWSSLRHATAPYPRERAKAMTSSLPLGTETDRDAQCTVARTSGVCPRALLFQPSLNRRPQSILSSIHQSIRQAIWTLLKQRLVNHSRPSFSSL